MTAGVAAPCRGLPIPLERCPVCDEGIKPTRSFAWIDAKKLFEGFRDTLNDCSLCGWMLPENADCTVRNYTRLNDRDLLIWAGTQHYPEPFDFLEEAMRLGVSSRVPGMPKGAEPGKTWLFAAHRKAISRPSEDGKKDVFVPGVIVVARLKAVERIVTDDTPDEDLEKLVKQGLTPVVVPKSDKDHQ